jgi:hypothetical protein
VVLVEHLLGVGQVVLDLGLLAQGRPPARRCSCAPRWPRPTWATSA